MSFIDSSAPRFWLPNAGSGRRRRKARVAGVQLGMRQHVRDVGIGRVRAFRHATFTPEPAVRARAGFTLRRGDYASPSACAESAPRLSGRASPSESPRHSDADSSRRAEVAKAEKNRKGRRNSTITTGNSVDGTPQWSEEARRARSGSVAMAMPHAKVREARAPRPDEHASPAQVLSLLGFCEP